MPVAQDEIRKAVELFKEEFQDNFPGENALKAASQYCNAVLSLKMHKLLEKCFGFKEPLELIAILGFIHEQAKKTAAQEPKPGRPRLPRESRPTVRLEPFVD